MYSFNILHNFSTSDGLFILDPAVAFWLTRTTPFVPRSILRYETEKLDLGFDVDPSTGIFTCPATSIYFTTFSALAGAGEPLELYTTNTDPVVGLKTTSTNSGEMTFQSRSAIVSATRGSQVSLTNARDFLGSNAGQQISWSSFNIDDAMRINEYFFAGRTTTQLNPNGGNDIAYTNFWVKSSMALNEQTNVYTCPRTGIYYFFASIGSTRHTSGIRVQAIITHERTALADDRRSYYIKMLSTYHNGIESASRGLVINCEVGQRVYVYGQGAEVFSDDAVQTSFGGFYYDPGHGTQVAFSAYKTQSYGGSISNEGSIVDFDIVEINVGSAFSAANNEFIVPTRGVYLITISAGLEAGESLNLNLMKGIRAGGNSINFLTEVDLYHRDTTHGDIITVSRTILIELQVNEVLRLETEGATGFFSDAESRLTYFAGLLIYTI